MQRFRLIVLNVVIHTICQKKKDLKVGMRRLRDDLVQNQAVALGELDIRKESHSQSSILSALDFPKEKNGGLRDDRRIDMCSY